VQAPHTDRGALAPQFGYGGQYPKDNCAAWIKALQACDAVRFNANANYNSLMVEAVNLKPPWQGGAASGTTVTPRQVLL